jgi:O-antigen/teichoic acid export membrane protein
MPLLARLKALLTGDSLRGRALSSGGMTLLSIAAGLPLRLASNLILTRLLMPEAFGLMALVNVIHGALEMASDVGLGKSVIRNDRGGETQYLRVVWTVKILRNFGIVAAILALALGLYLFGPLMAGSQSVYADPLLPPVLAASAMLSMLGGLTAPSVLLAKRELRLARVTLYQILSQVIGLAVTVAACLVFRNVWGLVAGGLVQALVWLVMTHTVIPGPRMRLAWDREQTREMWAFGRWIIPASVGEFLAANGDRLAFAALLPPAQFGLYAVAYVWVQTGMLALSQIGGTVFLPVLSEIRRRNAARLAGVLWRGLALYVAMAAAVFAGCWLLGAYGIAVLYTGAYATVGPLVIALAFKVLFLSLRALGQMVLAEGDSRHIGITQMVRGLSVVLSILAGFAVFGIGGAMLLHIVAVAPALWLVMRHRSVSERLPVALTGGLLAFYVLVTVVYFLAGGLASVEAVLG